MKHIGMLGPLAVVATALAAWTGTAAASTLTSPEGTTYTGSIVAASTNSKLTGSFVTVECNNSEAKGNVEQHGVVNAGGKLSTLTFTSCNYSTTVTNKGSLEVDASGTVFSKGAAISVSTSVGTCVFTTDSTFGTLIGSLNEGFGATIDINSAKIPRTGGNFLCGSSGTWGGSYEITTPSSLFLGEGGGPAIRSTPGAFSFFVGVEQTKTVTLEGTKAQTVTAEGGSLQSWGGGSPPAGLDVQSWGCVADWTYSTSHPTCTLSIKNTASTPTGTYYFVIDTNRGDKYISIRVS